MNSAQIVYVSHVIAGAGTSFDHVLRHHGVEPQTDDSEHRWQNLINVRSGEETIAVTLSVSRNRARQYYELSRIAEKPQVARELAWLARADGVVFVVDSQAILVETNRLSFEKLRRDYEWLGKNLGDVPIVFQANKRDLPEVLTMADVRAQFTHPHRAFVESVATSGIGTVDAIETLVRMISVSRSLEQAAP